MKIIKKLNYFIEDEVGGAKEYAMCALKNKDERPELAKLLYSLANDEMDHMMALHEAVVDIIAEYRKRKGDPPESMMAVYDYLHEKHIEEASEVNRLLAMYK